MNVLMGETGAGKSILIDALNLALGGRASPSNTRTGAKKTEITACFNLHHLPTIKNWLSNQDLENLDECIVRRVINNDGRNRGYINGHIVPLSILKMLGAQLVQMHNQHQHHQLMEPEYQRALLDEFSTQPQLLETVKKLHQQWLNIKKEIAALHDQKQQDKLSLLNYQIKELEDLNLKANEVEHLEKQHQQLSKSQELIEICQNALNQLEASENTNANPSIQGKLYNILNNIHNIKHNNPKLMNCAELINQAIIQIEEATGELESLLSTYRH